MILHERVTSVRQFASETSDRSRHWPVAQSHTVGGWRGIVRLAVAMDNGSPNEWLLPDQP